MAEVNMERALETYETLCRMLDNKGWKYEKIEDKLMIKSGVKGDDFPIDFLMRVNPRNEIVSFFSMLPFSVEESKRVDMAVAICVANNGMVDGSFDYDIADGDIFFRLTSSYKESDLSEALLAYMLMVSATTIDAYNDKFFMLTKGMMTLEQFIASEKAD